MKKQLVFLFKGLKEIYLSPQQDSFLAKALSDAVVHAVWPSVLVKQIMFSYIISKSSKDDISILCTTDCNIKNSYVVVHKEIFNDIEILHSLKKNNNIIIFDVIDGIISNVQFTDAILCCSIKSYKYYSRKYNNIPILFTEHCADLRIMERTSVLKKFSPYYFGMRDNFLYWDSILKIVKPCFTTARADWLPCLELSNFHYALRPRHAHLVFKPFTKGIVAALCDANILVGADDGDAALYLGEDYPYLIKEKLTEAIVLDRLRKAGEDFPGGRDWLDGLAVMRGLKERFSFQNIARQFWRGMALL